jgi:hypothetical protein
MVADTAADMVAGSAVGVDTVEATATGAVGVGTVIMVGTEVASHIPPPASRSALDSAGPGTMGTITTAGTSTAGTTTNRNNDPKS